MAFSVCVWCTVEDAPLGQAIRIGDFKTHEHDLNVVIGISCIQHWYTLTLSIGIADKIVAGSVYVLCDQPIHVK